MKRTIGHVSKVGQLQLTKEMRTALGIVEGGAVMFDLVSSGRRRKLVITPVPEPDSREVKQLQKQLAKLAPIDLRAGHTNADLRLEAAMARKLRNLPVENPDE